MSDKTRQIDIGKKEHKKHRLSKKRDEKRRASPPGRHVSASGKVYYERRENRTDRPGKKV